MAMAAGRGLLMPSSVLKPFNLTFVVQTAQEPAARQLANLQHALGALTKRSAQLHQKDLIRTSLL